MCTLSLAALVLGLAAVIGGIVIEGTAESPVALFLPFMFVTLVLDLHQKRPDLWARFGLIPIVIGASASGVAWTLGPEHAASNTAGLVWVGLSSCIAASAEATAAKARSATVS